MAFTYSTNIQDRIALTVFGTAYSSLTSSQKAHLDGTWATGLLSTGVAYDALTRITQIANWFEQAGSTSAPQAWEHWLVAETSMLLAQTYRPERYQEFTHQREVAIDACLDSFTLREPTGTFSSSNTSASMSVNAIRFYVLNQCARRKESGTNTGLRRRIFPPIDMVDSCMMWVLNYVFNKEFWNFRKRDVTMIVHYLAQPTDADWDEQTKTLTQTNAFVDLDIPSGACARLLVTGSDGGEILGDYQIASKTDDSNIVLSQSISLDGDDLTGVTGSCAVVEFRGLLTGETFDAVASRRFYYSDTAGLPGQLSWVDATQMSDAKSRFQQTTARPAYFRTEIQSSSAMTWHLAPFPSDTYILKGAVFVSGPGTPSSATDTTAFSKFPSEFTPVIKDMVLAKVLQAHNASDAERYWTRAVEQIVTLLPQFTDQGLSTRMPTTEDVYQDRLQQVGIGTYPWAGWLSNAGGLT